MSVTVVVRKINVDLNIAEFVEEQVAVEAPVNIFVNENYIVTLLATPTLQKELALGWLFDEGILRSLEEIKQVRVSGDKVNVTTKQMLTKDSLQTASVSRLYTTSCGLSTSKFLKTITKTGERKVESDYKVKADEITRMAQKLEESELFRSTGGVHVAALFEGNRLVAFAEDVGRHNTFDKVIGIGLISKVRFTGCILASSGRQPADMVLKAAKMGIPIVISRAAPIRSGIIAAEKTGVTLACFVRGQQMNVYTHPERILIDK